MQNVTTVVDTFPSIRIPSETDGLPVEVSLIVQLGHGSGSQLIASVVERQQKHRNYVDELDEPSTKLAGIYPSNGDLSSLYSFVVGPKGHPFHRHAGNRIFTAVSGSGGAQLRFSTSSMEQIKADPKHFLKGLRYINIPPDCMFTVRFGGNTWHQFYPLSKKSLHPVLFALSCHTNELGGDLPDELKEKVLANQATIPSLTELLPPEVEKLLNSSAYDEKNIPTTTLAINAAAGTLSRFLCNMIRRSTGIMRTTIGNWIPSPGFMTHQGFPYKVTHQPSAPEDSLLLQQLENKKLHHEDTFTLEVSDIDFKNLTASQLLEHLLEGFLLNAPKNVSRLMTFRNLLVSPLGLRTSPLGCPVSSLLSEDKSNLFANQYPVLDQQINADDTDAQVILGADDKHLQFRACVSVKVLKNGNVEFSLGNRVHCKNLFGRFYMGVIDKIHRTYIVPTMLKKAVGHVITPLTWELD